MSLLQDFTDTYMLDILRYSTIPRVRFMEPVHGRSECSVNLDPNVGQNAKHTIGMKVSRTMTEKVHLFIHDNPLRIYFLMYNLNIIVNL